MTFPRPSRADVEAAAARVGAVIRRTPVLVLRPEDTGLDATVAVKLELMQHSGSFKARGALNSVLSLPPGVEGVCAASGGNHAAAVAWAARRAGLAADVFVPRAATPAKIDRIREYGARVHLVDGHVREALARCRRHAEDTQTPLLHPYDTPETVSGAGTVGLELVAQVPDARLVVVSCGGGGLYAGVAAAIGAATPVQPVEPELCPNLAAALAAGEPVDTEVGGIAADSLGAPRIGRIALATALDAGVEPVLVTESAIADARRFLWQQARVLAEPGAVTGLAAVLTGAVAPGAGQIVAVVVSGGNNATLP